MPPLRESEVWALWHPEAPLEVGARTRGPVEGREEKSSPTLVICVCIYIYIDM